jgi:hypothetical protein
VRTKLIAGFCGVAVCLLLVPTAEAARWRGKTKQGRLAAVHTGPDGLVSQVRIKYLARCTDGDVLTGAVQFLPPLDQSTTSSFQDGGVFRFRIRGGERARATVSLDGGLRRSGRWTGNFRLRVRVTKNGRFVATCRVRRVGWNASPV